MIETNQYKKGVIALIQIAKKLNSQLGAYKNHFITEKAQFIIELTNGWLEVDIYIARECEENSEAIMPEKLKKAAQSYWNEDNPYARPRTIQKEWTGLFSDAKDADSKTERRTGF